MRRILVYVISSDIKFHENGKLKYKCMFVNGKLHGDYCWFHENGHILNKSIYVNGKPHINYWFYENGKLESKYTYVNGVVSGKIEYK